MVFCMRKLRSFYAGSIYTVETRDLRTAPENRVRQIDVLTVTPRRHPWIPRSYTTVCYTADRNCRELYCLCKLLHRCDTVQATKQQAGPSGRESGVLEGVDKRGRR